MENEKLCAVPQEGDKIVKRLHIKLKDIGWTITENLIKIVHVSYLKVKD